MIGKAYTAIFPYYDRVNKKQNFKSRPCLIIGQADLGDYVVLPISSITDRTKIDPIYDIPLDNNIFTFLKKFSYLRTHKQTVVNLALLKSEIVDFKAVHEDTFITALAKIEDFQKSLIENAL